MTRFSRRTFLRTSATALVCASFAPGCTNHHPGDTSAPPVARVIDTHTHFYDPSLPRGVPWPPKDDPVLYRTVRPPEYERLARPLGITGTVVVEASPRVEDTIWLLGLAQDDPFIVGVVGNLDPGSPEFRQYLPRLATNPLFRGIRLRDRPWPARLEDGTFRDDLRRLADVDLELDVNTGPAGLKDVERLAALVPALRVVVNHCGNVPIDGGPVKPEWLAAMRALAARPNVWCKVSGLVEATGRTHGDAPADLAYYRPVVDALGDAFGENRLIYGSNWPVCTRFAMLATVHAIVREYFTSKGQAASEKYFWKNAKDVYKWPDRA